MATNVQTAQGLGLAIFGAAAGGYLNYLESRAGDASALATELAGYYKAEMKKDLSVADVLANLQLKSGTAAYTAAKASLDMQVAGGATVAVAASSLVTYLFGLTDTTSDFYATATAFKARVDVAVAWSKGAGATEQSVTKLVAYQAGIDGSAPVDPTLPVVTTTALTTKADVLTTTADSNKIEGVVGTGSTSTLNATDMIDGGDGADSLIVKLDANFTGFTTGSLKNVETLDVTSGGSAARTFDASGVTGLTTVNVSANKQGFSLIDLASVGQTINMTAAGSNLTVSAATAEVTKASTDSLTVNVSDAGSSASSVMTVRAAGIEMLNIGSGGATGNFLDLAAGATTSVVATGTNSLQVTAVDATLKSFDASGLTGKVTADLRASTALTSASTGSGDDSVTVADLGSPIAALAGGSGADTITFRGTAAATLQPALTGFETVAFRGIAGAITADFSKSSDVATIRFVDGLAAAVTTSGLANAKVEFTQSESTATIGVNGLTHAGTGSLTVSTATPGVDPKTYGAVTAARVDSVEVTVGANTTIGAQTYTTAQTVIQTVSGTLGDVTATAAESLTISADSTGVVNPVGSTNLISAPAAGTVSISASRSGTLGALDLRADLAKTVTISGVGAVAYDATTPDLSSVTSLTVSTTGSYDDTAAAAAIGDKSASVNYDASGVNGATTLNVANYAGTATTASVVVKGSTISNNTIAVGTKHNSIDVTAGIGTNSITLADLAKGTSTVPLTVKITSNGVAALSDTLVFTLTTGAEDVSGLYSTVTLSGVDTIDLAGTAGGTLTMNAASVSGQTIAFSADVNTLTLVGTDSADVISISKVTNDAVDTIAINGGLGADSITGHIGIDVITGGKGADTIVLTETTDALDTVVYEDTAANNGVDAITGFIGGSGKDILDFTAFLGATSAATLVTASADPGTGSAIAAADKSIVILTDITSGQVITTASGLAAALTTGGEYVNVNAATTAAHKYVFLTAASATATTYNVFYAESASSAEFSNITLVGTVAADVVYSALDTTNFA